MCMPNISNKEVHKFWHEYHDNMVYKIISFMENVETWTLDGNSELENVLNKLSAALDNIGYIDLQEEEKLIQLVIYIKMGRALRLLQFLDTAHPGAAAKLITFAKANLETADDLFSLFLQRNVVFERLRLLGRIFTKDRLDTVLNILRGGKNAN